MGSASFRPALPLVSEMLTVVRVSVFDSDENAIHEFSHRTLLPFQARGLDFHQAVKMNRTRAPKGGVRFVIERFSSNSMRMSSTRMFNYSGLAEFSAGEHIAARTKAEQNQRTR
jgi:hypothetical protein